MPEFDETLASLLRVVRGYRRHADVMGDIREERTKMLKAGYGDPLDGFPATAAAVAINWRDRVTEDIRELDDVDLINTLVSTVRETGRYYSEADLTWSKVWLTYAPEHSAWMAELRSNAIAFTLQRTQVSMAIRTLKEHHLAVELSMRKTGHPIELEP